MKAGDSMRKTLLMLLLIAMTVCLTSAVAETEYALTPCAGKIAINEDAYIVLTPANLGEHPELIASLGKSQEELLADWTERGVQLQAWTKKMDASLEVTVIQDEESRQYYDLEQQTRQTRAEYLKAHRNSSKYAEQGYTIMNLEWKKQKLGGNFLKYEYKREADGQILRGIARKTIRNGYTVTLDYQVYNRLPRGTDENYLNRIANTVAFDTLEPVATDGTQTEVAVPGTASGLLQITAAPPAETNTGEFTVEGHAMEGAHLIGVAMRWSSSTPLKFTTDTTRAGNFKLKVTLPEEGVWLLTLNLEVNGAIVAEEVFSTTTYSKTILPVVMDADPPAQLTGDELVLSGVTSKGVTVQCIVSNGTTTFDKTIRTNATGTFKFKVPTSLEGDYNITLAFSKKNFNTRRLTYTARRSLTPEDTKQRAVTTAIHPSYNALNRNLNSYIGTVMAYNVYIVDVQHNGEEWTITAALRKLSSGYADLMIFNAGIDPELEVDSQAKLYGSCIGAYQVQSEEGSESYPSFDYLFKEE